MIAGVIEKKIVKDNLELPSAELSRFENKEVTKIYIDKDNNYFLNDTVTRNENIIIYIKEKKIKEYHLHGFECTLDDWKEMRKERAGLPWYKNPSLKGTARL